MRISPSCENASASVRPRNASRPVAVKDPVRYRVRTGMFYLLGGRADGLVGHGSPPAALPARRARGSPVLPWVPTDAPIMHDTVLSGGRFVSPARGSASHGVGHDLVQEAGMLLYKFRPRWSSTLRPNRIRWGCSSSVVAASSVLGSPACLTRQDAVPQPARRNTS